MSGRQFATQQSCDASKSDQDHSRYKDPQASHRLSPRAARNAHLTCETPALDIAEYESTDI